MADSAADFLPERINLTALRKAADGCRGCDLYKDATQTVFGRGPAEAGLMLVGEQPGDREDREGEPFVGPAGTLLRKALEEAGLAAEEVYLTKTRSSTSSGRRVASAACTRRPAPARSRPASPGCRPRWRR